MSVNYAQIAISYIELYLGRLESAIKKSDKNQASKERELLKMELLEIYRAFEYEHSQMTGLCASFWDFITELYNTPGNYKKSFEDLNNRSVIN